MTKEEFIKKAIEGGYWHRADYLEFEKDGLYHEKDGEGSHACLQSIVLDPKAWQAVGKVEGWDERKECFNCKGTGFIETKTIGVVPCDTCEYGLFPLKDWKYHMHRMIEALVDGKTIDKFLTTL